MKFALWMSARQHLGAVLYNRHTAFAEPSFLSHADFKMNVAAMPCCPLDVNKIRVSVVLMDASSLTAL